jgi:hypothetical protein
MTGFTAFLVYGIGGLLVPLVLLYYWLRESRREELKGVGATPAPLHRLMDG